MKNAMTMALSLMMLAVGLVIFAGGFEIGAISMVISWIALFASSLFVIDRFLHTANMIDENAQKKDYELIFRVQ